MYSMRQTAYYLSYISGFDTVKMILYHDNVKPDFSQNKNARLAPVSSGEDIS
jgi:hypothetical protein